MEPKPSPTLDQRLALRQRESGQMAASVIAGLCGLLLLKWQMFPSVAGAGPLGYLYGLVYTVTLVLCLAGAALLRFWPWRWLPTALAMVILGFGVALTLVDLHFGDDYSAYTIAIFGLGVFYQARAWVYGVLLAGSFLVLTVVLALTNPYQLLVNELGTRFLIVALAFVGCTRLEKQRNTSEVLTVQLEEANGQLRELSIRDPLTGLYNRRFLLEFLEAKRTLAIRMGIPLSVVLIDLDHFKTVNDRYGHPTGDQVLKEMARFLTEGIRESDLAARYGGEEFILVLPQAHCENAARVTERILGRVRGHRFPGVPLTVTFSAGVATLTDREPIDRLLGRADQRLYEAKRARDQVVSSGPA